MQIILIGGAPTTGKSTIAKLLSKHLNLPWFSTDQIRNIMRTATNIKDLPNLFEPDGYDGEGFLNKFSAEEIVKMEIAQGEITWNGVKDFIKDGHYPWIDGFILEGIGILPNLIEKDFKNNMNIKSIFLVDENPEKIRKVIFTRGLWDEAHKYPDYVKEKEVDWVLLFNKKIIVEAKKFGYPIIEVNKHEGDLKTVLNSLKII